MVYDSGMQTPTLCEAIRFETPRDRYLLDGLVYGPTGGRRGFIWLHGLESSAFGKHGVLAPLTGPAAQALYFNNRGHDTLTGIKQVDDSAKGYRWASGGTAKELFTDCTDDIAGAVDALKARGAEEIILAGHSTGCQKAVYYLAQPEADPAVRGAVLICPLSDYTAAAHLSPADELERATTAARRLVADGKSMDLLPTDVWDETLSAQRFLSLYTPDSPEEIFTYGQPHKTPETLRSVHVPQLVILAGADEYADRPAAELADWFRSAVKQAPVDTAVIEGSLHNLRDHEAEISRHIAAWTKQL